MMLGLASRNVAPLSYLPLTSGGDTSGLKPNRSVTTMFLLAYIRGLAMKLSDWCEKKS
jgi:hypothetical protein